MAIGERIKRKREEFGISQTDLAKRIGVSKQTLYKYESNIVTNIPSNIIEQIASILDVSPAYLMGWEKLSSAEINNIYPIALKCFPMLGKIACGKPTYASEDRESYVIAGTDIKADFCLKANGDSMINARICDGDIVFIRQQDIVENGEIAAVVVNSDNEATLKRFFYYADKNMVILKPENPAYEDMIFTKEELNNFHILGKAVAFQSDVK